jgi:hypothetical protein
VAVLAGAVGIAQLRANLFITGRKNDLSGGIHQENIPEHLIFANGIEDVAQLFLVVVEHGLLQAVLDG